MLGYLTGVRRLVLEMREGCVLQQYEFNFPSVHSYRTFLQLLQLLFCCRYDDPEKRRLQNAFG